MNSFGFSFLLCLLSLIVVVKCGYRRGYRRDYRPRLSYDYYDGDDDDDEYPSHFQREYSRHYPRHSPNQYPLNYLQKYRRRGPSLRGNRDCYVPKPQVYVGKYYEHPRNDSCVVTYAEGDIFCDDYRKHVEPRIIPVPKDITKQRTELTSSTVKNPLYKQICPNSPAITTARCYTPLPSRRKEIRFYQHPSVRQCVVSYDNGSVYCNGELEPVLRPNYLGKIVPSMYYTDLCSFFCFDLLPYMCLSTDPYSCETCFPFP